MSKQKYEVTGKINVPVEAMQDAAVGDVIEADLDKDFADMLIGAGALRPVTGKQADPKPAKSAVTIKADGPPAAESKPAEAKPAAKSDTVAKADNK